MTFNVELNLNYIEKISIFESETHFIFIGKSYIKKIIPYFQLGNYFLKKMIFKN